MPQEQTASTLSMQNESSITSTLPVSYTDIIEAANRIHGVAHRTPVMKSRTFDNSVKAYVFFKCENFQRAGAFKFRGAYNALVHLSESQKRRGVLTYSSGNFAQALALAGHLLDVPTTIVMPDNAPAVKKEATLGYGAEIVEYNPKEIVREDLGQHIAQERSLPIIPPYNHPHVVAGQGTAAKELFEEIGPLDLLLVCCGGGGLLSGCAITAKALSPGCRVIGVEPENGDDATRSFHTGILHTVHNPDTIADGARTPSLGTITFPLIRHYVDDMVTVSDDAILRAMRFLLERMKLVVEPTGALAVAALLESVVSAPGRRIGVTISGGNVDLYRLCELLSHHP